MGKSHQNLNSLQPVSRWVTYWKSFLWLFFSSDPIFWSSSSYQLSVLIFLRFLFLVVPLILHLLLMLPFLFLFLYFKCALSTSLSFSCFHFFLLLSPGLPIPPPFPYLPSTPSLSPKYLDIIQFYSVSNCQLISSRYTETTYMYKATQIICRFFMNSLYVFHA